MWKLWIFLGNLLIACRDFGAQRVNLPNQRWCSLLWLACSESFASFDSGSHLTRFPWWLCVCLFVCLCNIWSCEDMLWFYWYKESFFVDHILPQTSAVSVARYETVASLWQTEPLLFPGWSEVSLGPYEWIRQHSAVCLPPFTKTAVSFFPTCQAGCIWMPKRERAVHATVFPLAFVLVSLQMHFVPRNQTQTLFKSGVSQSSAPLASTQQRV